MMRSLVWAAAAALLASPVTAQSPSSARVPVIENPRPTWRESERLHLSATPTLAFGDTADVPYRFRQVRGVMRLDDGKLMVADGGSAQLRLFTADGKFVSASGGKGNAPGQLPGMSFVRRLNGDTIAVGESLFSIALFAPSGAFVRSSAGPSSPEAAANRVMTLPLNVHPNGARLMVQPPAMQKRAVGTQWTDTMQVLLYAADNTLQRSLGAFPYLVFEQGATNPSPPWLSAQPVFAAGAERFYGGFGDRYEIRVFASDGQPQSIIRRAWKPTPVTGADWETWVIEWSKIWVKSTGAERERDVQKVRDEPYAETLPAFADFLVDRTGRLWVREAHWQDAIAAGSLTDLPAVPSNWSVFDTRGRWLGDVSMPANFQPLEIGRDYVAGKARANNVNQIVMYGLNTGKP